MAIYKSKRKKWDGFYMLSMQSICKHTYTVMVNSEFIAYASRIFDFRQKWSKMLMPEFWLNRNLMSARSQIRSHDIETSSNDAYQVSRANDK